MVFLIFLLSLISYYRVSSSSTISVFPPRYSQFFDIWQDECDVTLSEAFLAGEENQAKLGFSLWIKIEDMAFSGNIFSIQRKRDGLDNDYTYYYDDKFPSLDYSRVTSSAGVNSYYITLTWFYGNNPNFSTLTLSLTPSSYWIFIGISASYDTKSSLLYYNNFGTSSSATGTFYSELSIPFNSVLKMGNYMSFTGRVGDFKIYNNIYNQVSDWSSLYSSACTSVSCSVLSPSLCYAECDTYCASETNWFFPIVQPSLYSYRAYRIVYDDFAASSYENIAYYMTIPTGGWNDYSITGWAQFSSCKTSATTFFQVFSNSLGTEILSIGLTNSVPANSCDEMTVKIYNTDGVSNNVYTSVSATSASYIGSWLFFAVTHNSASKLLTLYTHTGGGFPSTGSPLSSNSVNYVYTATAMSPDLMSFNVGGNSANVIYPGNYADIRLYPGHYIDTSLVVYTSNSLYSSADYLDPYCTSWSSIWYCGACQTGYFVENGICKKCHPSCASCSSGDTETDCISCASGYYSQPGHPTVCFDYCPYGYTWDSTTKQCTGTQGLVADFEFEDNIAGDFTIYNIYVQFGIVAADYYPAFDYCDPQPANKRGIHLEKGSLEIKPQASANAGRLFGTDFTVELWCMLPSSGTFYTTESFKSYEYYDTFIYFEHDYYINLSDFYIDSYQRLVFNMANRQTNQVSRIYSPVSVSSLKPEEWALYSVSVTFDSSAKTTQILLVRNTFSYTETVSGYYKETSGMLHFIGNGASAMNGFIYSFSLYNYGKTYSQIASDIGTCTSCSACPLSLNYCLPTCNATQYVDSNGKCQSCPSECAWTCSRDGTCNLCYDDLCYKCTKYEIGTCTQCVDNAILTSGKCKCQTGYVKQVSICTDKCSDGYYLDAAAQECLACPDHCIRCSDSDTCTVCDSDFVLENDTCHCETGYFLDTTDTCSKCDTSCLTCSIISSNCTSCISTSPILYDTNQCYPCDSFEGYSSSYVVPTSELTTDLISQLSSKCTELCGDGRNMGQLKCDDGNNKNGDGCSSNCTVEVGWSCSGGSINKADTCKDTTPPSPILAYLSESSSGYLLALSFSEPVSLTADMSQNINIKIDNILKFSWSVKLVDSIYIITLNMYENVATGTGVTVAFIDPTAVVDMSGNVMEKSSVKVYLPTSYTYQLGQAITTTVNTATAVATTGAVAGSASSGFSVGMFNLQALWGMVEMMQFQNYLIFLSPKYPDNLKSYLSALSIANGNFLPNPFQQYLIKNDPFSDPPERFLEESFNTDFLMNAGQFVLVWGVIMAGLPIVLMLFRRWPKFSFLRWLKNSYIFAILLRTGIESFLEITLSVFLQWREITEPAQDVGYLSLSLSFITAVYLVLTFILIFWQVTIRSEAELVKERHERRFGTLYEGFKRHSKLTVSFLVFQNLRRVIFVILCVFFFEYTTVQVALSTLLSFLYTVALIVLRPFEKFILGNALHITSETFYFAAHCIILKFLDDQLSDDDRTNLGWGVIALLSLSLLLHLVAMLVVQIMGFIQGLKKLKAWFMKNFANKFARFYGRKSTLDTIILDKKVNAKGKKKYEREDTNENLAYFEGKKKTLAGDEESFSFRKTKIRPEDDPSISETLGDESFKKSDTTLEGSDIFEESFSSLKKKKKIIG